MEQPSLPFDDPEARGALIWFAAWAETVEFRTAATVPEAPHSYWRAAGDPDYARVRETILRYGTPRDWPQPGSHFDGQITPRKYRYLLVDEWEYWIGPPGFVNRAIPDRLT